MRCAGNIRFDNPSGSRPRAVFALRQSHACRRHAICVMRDAVSTSASGGLHQICELIDDDDHLRISGTSSPLSRTFDRCSVRGLSGPRPDPVRHRNLSFSIEFFCVFFFGCALNLTMSERLRGRSGVPFHRSAIATQQKLFSDQSRSGMQDAATIDTPAFPPF